jgi:threonine dehydratase
MDSTCNQASAVDDGLSRAAIDAAAETLAPYLRRTPCISIDGEDFGLAGIRLVFKLEFLQHAGSFKARGAFLSMLRRTPGGAGVVAASGGNHGAAVAFAARRLGIPAAIFVPEVATAAKLEQIRSYGAALHIVGDRYADALAASVEHAERTGAMPIHAFDQIETLLGQATVAREFEADAPPLDAVLVAVGGGGLIGGMAAWTRGNTRLVGVEPELAPTLAHALAAGEPVDAPAGGVAADSLAPRRVGSLMFPLARRFVAESVLVADAAIVDAQHALWRVLRVVAEPGGAAALAALLSGRWRAPKGSTVGVLLCGANTSAVQFKTP